MKSNESQSGIRGAHPEVVGISRNLRKPGTCGIASPTTSGCARIRVSETSILVIGRGQSNLSAVSEVTRILDRMQQGDSQAADELLPLVYEELRKLAAVRMAALPPGQTLQATALVHEAWLRLAGSEDKNWNGRGHFFGAAAEAMRHILVDRARHKSAQKRGGGLQRIDLDHVDVAMDADADLILALDEALTRYAQKDPQGAELIKLRFFAGLPNHQAAALLGVPERTAKRTWAFARAWLYAEIQKTL